MKELVQKFKAKPREIDNPVIINSGNDTPLVDLEYVGGKLIYFASKTNVTYVRTQQPNAVSINKYSGSFSKGTINSKLDKIVSVSFANAPIGSNNLILNWYFNGTTLYVEFFHMFSGTAAGSNIVENLKTVNLRIAYTKVGE